jgi:hypothetical protein
VVGLAALAGSVHSGASARGAADDLSAHTAEAWTRELLARDAEGKSAELRAIGFGTFAVAAVAVSGVLWFRRHHLAGIEALRVTIDPVERGMAVSLQF